MSDRERRVADNETTFREANEKLDQRFDELSLDDDDFVAFICECGNPRCTEVIRMRRSEYTAVREIDSTFALVPGHEDDPTEQIVTDDVVEQSDRFAVVRKRQDYRGTTERQAGDDASPSAGRSRPGHP